VEGSKSHVIFRPQSGEVLKRVRPFEYFLGSDKGLDFDEKVVFNSDWAGDGFNFSLEVGDLGNEDLSDWTRGRARFSNWLGEHVKFNLESVNLLLVFKIISSNFCVGTSDLWGELLLGDRELGHFKVEFVDSVSEFGFSDVKGWGRIRRG
jgi:hypothetical protein